MAKVDEKHGTPARITIGVGVAVAIIAGFSDISVLEEMVNVGTLFAFVLVSIGVIVLRRTRPDLERSFKVPLMPVVPILSVLACLWLMINLTAITWVRFLVWMAIGVIVYFVYGKQHSMVGRRGGRRPGADPGGDQGHLAGRGGQRVGARVRRPSAERPAGCRLDRRDQARPTPGRAARLRAARTAIDLTRPAARDHPAAAGVPSPRGGVCRSAPPWVGSQSDRPMQRTYSMTR